MKLTEKQQLTLDFIASYWGNNGISPSIADIRNGIGLGANSNNTIIFRLNSLEGYGLILRNKKIARSIRLTDLGKSHISQVKKTEIDNTSTNLKQYAEVIFSNVNNFRKDVL
ncbi:MAG: hypothetical protein NT135_01660 [Candidatus Berkelbacteria bacterium]|nr:hypothetical protein [Candidatus Berkelbacteria bacterium]